MAGTDGTAVGNGVIISAVKSGFVHFRNTAPDQPSMAYVQCTYTNSPVDVEPERFREKGTDTASVTFSQLDSEKAETWSIIIEYEIYKSG